VKAIDVVENECDSDDQYKQGQHASGLLKTSLRSVEESVHCDGERTG
jgi:hypothetical protein